MALLLQDGRDKSSSDIPPCSTLFIANLGRTCTEDELKEVLSKYDSQILLLLFFWMIWIHSKDIDYHCSTLPGNPVFMSLRCVAVVECL